MKKNSEILDLQKKDRWFARLESMPVSQQDIYFLPEYYELSEKNGEGKAHCFVFEYDNHLALYPFLLNNINILNYTLDNEYYDIQGAYGYNGVVSSSYEDEFIRKFNKSFEQYCRENHIVTEFTRFHTLLENHRFSVNYLNIKKNRTTVYLDINRPYEDIWQKSYSSVNRNMIRKAMKQGVEIDVAKDMNSYSFFYNLYTETMSNVGAADYYFFNQDYFKNFSHLLGENQKLIVASYKGETICSILLMIYKEYAHYHLSARKKEYSSLASNNLILDYAIRFAQAQGCKFFHLGGGNTQDEEDYLFKFKSNFSRTFKEFYIGGKIHNEDIYHEIIRQWEDKYPEKRDQYGHLYLKYRI